MMDWRHQCVHYLSIDNMKVHSVRKKARKLDAFSTLASLNYVLNIVGLSCIYRDGTLKYHYPIWKIFSLIIVLLAANAYSIYIKVQSYDNKNIKFKDSIQMAYLLGYVQYIFDIIFVYKYGRQSYVEYFFLYDYIDSIIGISYYVKIKKSIGRMCIFFIIVGFVSSIINIVSWMSSFDWILLSVYSIEYTYLGIRLLSGLDMISNWIQIKYRLETIGDLLENYYCDIDNLTGVAKDVIHRNTWINSNDAKNIKNIKCGTNARIIFYGRDNIVIWLSRCYILLNEQCDYINRKYGFRIIITCVIHLLDMVIMMNLVVRLLMGTVVSPNNFRYLPIIAALVKTSIYTLILFCGIHSCEQNYRQLERIIRFIDHILINKKISMEIRETLKELKYLVISRPIKYHAMNFYRLDYATLVSMASVIVTYTIILLQTV